MKFTKATLSTFGSHASHMVNEIFFQNLHPIEGFNWMWCIVGDHKRPTRRRVHKGFHHQDFCKETAWEPKREREQTTHRVNNQAARYPRPTNKFWSKIWRLNRPPRCIVFNEKMESRKSPFQASVQQFREKSLESLDGFDNSDLITAITWGHRLCDVPGRWLSESLS